MYTLVLLVTAAIQGTCCVYECQMYVKRTLSMFMSIFISITMSTRSSVETRGHVPPALSPPDRREQRRRCFPSIVARHVPIPQHLSTTLATATFVAAAEGHEIHIRTAWLKVGLWRRSTTATTLRMRGRLNEGEASRHPQMAQTRRQRRGHAFREPAISVEQVAKNATA